MYDTSDKVMRGEIYLCDFGLGIGSEQTGVRPCIILSNNVGNKFSTIAQVIPITSSTTKKKLPTHVFLDANKIGLERDSIAITEQSRCVEQGRLFAKIGMVDEDTMKQIETALMINFGIMQPTKHTNFNMAVCV